MKESTKDALRNVVTMGYGVFVLNLPQIVPNEISLTVVQILGGVALGQGFINIISVGFGIDNNRSVLNKLNEQTAHIQALEDMLTLTNTLLQQFVDNANQPTTNSLPTPANLTVKPADITKLASPDQTVVASNDHTDNRS